MKNIHGDVTAQFSHAHCCFVFKVGKVSSAWPPLIFTVCFLTFLWIPVNLSPPRHRQGKTNSQHMLVMFFLISDVSFIATQRHDGLICAFVFVPCKQFFLLSSGQDEHRRTIMAARNIRQHVDTISVRL